MASYIITLRPAREDFTPESASDFETAQVEAHWGYLQKRHKEGKVVFVGRTTEAPFIGYCVIEAPNDDEALIHMNEDPVVSSGVFRAYVQPFMIALERK